MTSIKRKFFSHIEYSNEQGLLHRTDGPAREFANGDKFWYINGIRHREDGPAVEMYSSYKAWYLNDKIYLEEEWKEEVTRLKLKRILDL